MRHAWDFRPPATGRPTKRWRERDAHPFKLPAKPHRVSATDTLMAIRDYSQVLTVPALIGIVRARQRWAAELRLLP
jgi:hypothetical protein